MESEDKLVKDVKEIKHRITSSEYEGKSKKAKLEGDIQDKRRQLEILSDRISSLNDPKGIETTIKKYNDEYEQLQSRQRKEEIENLAKMKAVSDEFRHAIMLAKEKELTSRKEFEDAIKRASEEEKQRLIDEAEEKMIPLHDEISQLKSDLSRVKTDCYSLKNANVEFQEKEKKLDARATDLERVLTLVRGQLATEKMEKLSLQEKLQAPVELSARIKSQISKLFE